MQKIALLLLAFIFPISLFSQTPITTEAQFDAIFGQAVYLSADSIQKLPINNKLLGKWVLISSQVKNGQEDEMGRWGIQTLEFKNDRTLIITPGTRSTESIYWSYIENEKRLAIFSLGKSNELTERVRFPILKISETKLITTEWVSIKPDGKHYQKITFLKVE